MDKKNVKEVDVRIEGDEWQEALDKAFEQENEKTTIDGFRQGKAPKDVYLKKYGIGSLLGPAAELKFEDAYRRMLEENQDLDIVARPQGSVTKLEESGVDYRFSVPLRPEVKIGEYKNLGVEKPTVEVTDEEVQNELENLKKQYAELIVKEGAAESGDTVVIDFVGTKDGEEFEGGKAEDYSLELGSNSFIPGFEDQLIGVKAGDEKEVELEFPQEYPREELRGQPVKFHVKVKEVKAKKEPELNDDFFKDLGMEGIDSEEALLEQLRENIKARKESESENEYLNQLFDAAIANMEVEVPEQMITDETDRMLQHYSQQLQMQGIQLEDYYKMTNTTEDDLRKMLQPESEKRVKTRLLLEEVAKQEQLEATEEEAHKLLDELASQHQTDKEELLKMYGGIEPVKYELKMRKAIDVIKG